MHPSTQSYATPEALQIPDGGPAHPDEVVSDETLDVNGKRAILASWASDIHAVENAPSLRRLPSGQTIPLDDILAALASLPEHHSGAPPAGPSSRSAWPLRRRLSIRRWLAVRDDEDDDDPPSSPAVAAIPVRRRPVKAVGGFNAASVPHHPWGKGRTAKRQVGDRGGQFLRLPPLTEAAA